MSKEVVDEIMGLVDQHHKCGVLKEEWLRSQIESKLRELVERKPLSEERVWEIEADSYVASRRPEYTKDCFGDEKTIWYETKNFSFPLFARNIERAHGIINTEKDDE